MNAEKSTFMYLSTIFSFQIFNIGYNVVPLGDNERRTITLGYVTFLYLVHFLFWLLTVAVIM